MSDSVVGTIIENILENTKLTQDKIKINSKKDEIERTINVFLNEYDSNRKEILDILRSRSEKGKLNIIDEKGNIDIQKISKVISYENERIEKIKKENTDAEINPQGEKRTIGEEIYDNIVVNNLEMKIDRINNEYGIDTSGYTKQEEKVLVKLFDAIDRFKNDAQKIVDEFGGDVTNPECQKKLEELKSVYQSYFGKINKNAANNFDFLRGKDGSIIINSEIGSIITVSEEITEQIKLLSGERESAIKNGNPEEAQKIDEKIQDLSKRYGYDKETMKNILESLNKIDNSRRESFEEYMAPLALKDTRYYAEMSEFEGETTGTTDIENIVSESQKLGYEYTDSFLQFDFEGGDDFVAFMRETLREEMEKLEEGEPLTNSEGDKAIEENGEELDDSGIDALEKDVKLNGKLDNKDKIFIDMTPPISQFEAANGKKIDVEELDGSGIDALGKDKIEKEGTSKREPNSNDKMHIDKTPPISQFEVGAKKKIDEEELILDDLPQNEQEIEIPELANKEKSQNQTQLAVYKPRITDRIKGFINDIKNMGVMESFNKNFMSNDVQVPINESREEQLKGINSNEEQVNLAQEENIKKQNLLTKVKDSLKKAFGIKDEKAEKIAQEQSDKLDSSKNSKESKGGFDFNSPDEELMAKTAAVGKDAAAKLKNKDANVSTAEPTVSTDERED